MIRSFLNEETEQVFNGNYTKKFPAEIQNQAYRKLGYVQSAVLVTDLRMPPGNRLEKLEGVDKWSIRINNQWRVVFRWAERDPDPNSEKAIPGDAFEVEVSNH